ncbi:SEC-C metal-binding domain-containing protein [Janthinobacterium sp. CG_S6]|uniref:SEC-C metal-binding domain-containing protein n=1 Tax=Janthinobacterium sp. CG_S6 TaxID=3071707 RepID=UPI002DF7479A|nr:hypothetical protein [Janthinobacterium sp. CG_S6]
MTAIPAFCDNCGTVFPSGFGVQDASVTFFGCKAGPCPACGGVGSVPDGLIKVVGDVIRIISADERTLDQFKRLQVILEEAKKKKTSSQELATQLEKNSPEWAGLAAYILKYLAPKNAGEFWGILGVVLAAIPLILSSTPELDDKQVAAIVDKAVAAAIAHPAPAARPVPRAIETPKAKKKTGRNEKCPCQSGKKYKICCINGAKGAPR